MVRHAQSDGKEKARRVSNHSFLAACRIVYKAGTGFIVKKCTPRRQDELEVPSPWQLF